MAFILSSSEKKLLIRRTKCLRIDRIKTKKTDSGGVREKMSERVDRKTVRS